MAQLNFSDLMSSGNNSDKNRIGFFSLKNDGDTALVRVMHDDVQSLINEAFSVHNIEVNGKNRKINCVKEAHESTSSCPLCAGNYPIQNRVFVRLIEYSKDENGNIVATPKIWERPAKSQISELSGYINEYGPLSKCMFKIIRHGVPKDTDTKYQFLPLNAANYPESQFPITDAFNDYKVLGGYVLDKNAEDINTYLATGNFPYNKKGEDAVEVPSGTPYASAQSFTATADPVDDFPTQPMATQAPAQQATAPTNASFDFGNAQGITKPTRFY